MLVIKLDLTLIQCENLLMQLTVIVRKSVIMEFMGQSNIVMM